METSGYYKGMANLLVSYNKEATMETKRHYKLYVNGVLARKFMTLQMAVKHAIKYFPSYVVDERNNAVVWKGDK